MLFEEADLLRLPLEQRRKPAVAANARWPQVAPARFLAVAAVRRSRRTRTAVFPFPPARTAGRPERVQLINSDLEITERYRWDS